MSLLKQQVWSNNIWCASEIFIYLFAFLLFLCINRWLLCGGFVHFGMFTLFCIFHFFVSFGFLYFYFILIFYTNMWRRRVFIFVHFVLLAFLCLLNFFTFAILIYFAYLYTREFFLSFFAFLHFCFFVFSYFRIFIFSYFCILFGLSIQTTMQNL